MRFRVADERAADTPTTKALVDRQLVDQSLPPRVAEWSFLSGDELEHQKANRHRLNQRSPDSRVFCGDEFGHRTAQMIVVGVAVEARKAAVVQLLHLALDW